MKRIFLEIISNTANARAYIRLNSQFSDLLYTVPVDSTCVQMHIISK